MESNQDQEVEKGIGREDQDLVVERETEIDGEDQDHVVQIEEVAIVLLQESTEDHLLQDTGLKSCSICIIKLCNLF